MNVLGISCYYHDAAAALLCDGQLLAAAEEERFTRKKHDSDFPREAIQFCLSKAAIASRELDYVVFYEKPFEKFERLLMMTLQTYPSSWKLFREAMITWMADKIWVKSHIEQELGLAKGKVLFTQHHMAHAASTFLASPFETAAILTVDGVGEWTTASIGRGQDTSVELSREIRFPHSIGLLYSAFTAFLGFEVNEGEYKVMGMAPYGKPRFVDKVRRLIHQSDDGSFRLDMSFFAFHSSMERSYSPKFEDLFGEPRAPDAPFHTEKTLGSEAREPRSGVGDEQCRKNQYYADVAASVQHVTEEVLLNLARVARSTFPECDKLCIAGGAALNSVANARIVTESGFDNVFVQPAAGDGGGALGAALYAYHGILGHPRKTVMRHAYWGQDYDDGQIEAFLKEENVPYRVEIQEGKLLEYVATALQQGKVIGWFQGRFEWGPRALGNRSILADPRRSEMKDIVNLKVKFREPFRPFAPAVLAEKATEYFDLPKAAEELARFMLVIANVRPEKRKLIPAVTHVDGTARPQMVHEDSNPLFYRLIRNFGVATSIPVLLNTSYNLRGEPIVNSPREAYSTFRRSDIDLLVIGRFIIEKLR